MSEIEKEHMRIMIAAAVKRGFRPFYWALGLILTIFLAVAGVVFDVAVSQAKMISSEEAYRNFLPKNQYHILQKKEHNTDREAISNPSQSEYIYMKHNMYEAEDLGIVYRGGTQQ